MLTLRKRLIAGMLAGAYVSSMGVQLASAQDVGALTLNMPQQTSEPSTQPPAATTVSIIELEQPPLIANMPFSGKSSKPLPAKLVSNVQGGEPEALDVAAEGESDVGELVQQRFADGSVQVERWIVETDQGDLVNHGKYTQFNASGETILSGRYVMGKRDGEWMRTISEKEITQLAGTLAQGFTAPLTSRATFTADAIAGTWICVDANGGIVFEWNFSDGKRHGVSTWFDPQGQTRQQVTYVDNLANGPATIVLEAGKPAVETVLERGLMPRRIDRKLMDEKGKPNGMVAKEAYLVPTPFNIERHDWDSSRVEMQEVNPKDAVRHGQSVTFYANGQRAVEGHYDHGQRSGMFVWWHPNGQQQSAGEYQNDLEQGDWSWWHQNGMREVRGSYVDGAKVAEWSFWSDAGKLVRRTEPTNQRVAGREVTPVKISK